ncbi:MAG: flagellar basal body protein, partial [Sulfurimonas sp.]|nr:flagellar basal body protein [Sulfurimonas sp.]
MASIFNALNIGYSALSAAQVGINTTGHNIANAETEGYT